MSVGIRGPSDGPDGPATARWRSAIDSHVPIIRTAAIAQGVAVVGAEDPLVVGEGALVQTDRLTVSPRRVAGDGEVARGRRGGQARTPDRSERGQIGLLRST